MKSKQCSKCKETKDLSNFTKDKHYKDNLSIYCKTCMKNKHKVWRATEKGKKYYQNNKETLYAYQKEWLDIGNNRERMDQIKKEWRENNKDYIIEYSKEYYQNNKEEIHKKRLIRESENIQAKLSQRLRQRLNKAISGEYKSGSAVNDLGCSIKELKIYLEKQFCLNNETQEMMTWENYGRTGWHIDHINPLSKFDLTNRDQFVKACHYTNLQPLWAKDNLKKGDK